MYITFRSYRLLAIHVRVYIHIRIKSSSESSFYRTKEENLLIDKSYEILNPQLFFVRFTIGSRFCCTRVYISFH